MSPHLFPQMSSWMFQKNANKRDRQTTVFPTKRHYQKTPAVAVIKRHCTRSQTREDKLFRFLCRRKKASLFFCRFALFQGDEWGSRVDLLFAVFCLRWKTQSLALSQTHTFGLAIYRYRRTGKYFSLGSWQHSPPFSCSLSLILHLYPFFFTSHPPVLVF